MAIGQLTYLGKASLSVSFAVNNQDRDYQLKMQDLVDYLNTVIEAGGTQDLEDRLANNSNSALGAGMIGYVGRTVYAKLQDIPSLEDYGASVVDGFTSNQDRLVAAAAANQGKAVWVPAKTFVSTDNIPGFHSVLWFGPGSVKRGPDIFYVNPKDSQTNRLYIASSGGSLTNDGLSSAQPFSTFQSCFDATKSYGPVLNGIWQLIAAGGIYDFSGGQQTLTTPSKNRIVIRGPAASHPNVPSAIIDGGGSGVAYRHGLSASGSGVNAEFRDIRAQNFTEASGNTRIGILGENGADVLFTNCHTFACSWTGLYGAMASRFRVSGGIIDGNSVSGASGIITNDTESTIGYQATNTAQAPIVKNCTASGIYWSRGSQGHIDYVTFQDCGVGLEVEQFSSAAIPGCDFKRNTVGIRLRPGALFRQDGVPPVFNQGTADANTTPFDYCTMSGNGDELRTAQSYTRFAYDRVARTASGIVSGTFPTIYTMAADRLNGVGKSCRVHCKGVYTVTAGSSLTVNFGGMSLPLTVGAAGTNVTFEFDVELMEVQGGYRAIGSLSQGLSTFRYGTVTAGFDKTVANAISIGYSLAGAGDSLNIYRTDVYIMG